MMQDLGRFGIKTLTGSKVVEITPQGLKIEQNGNIQDIKADTVVIAAGSVSHNPLASVLENFGIEYHTAGDAKQVATAFEAVHQGFEAASNL